MTSDVLKGIERFFSMIRLQVCITFVSKDIRNYQIYFVYAFYVN